VFVYCSVFKGKDRVNMEIRELKLTDFKGIESLAEVVFGEGYLDKNTLDLVWERTHKNDINSSFVLIEKDRVVGFRLTYAAGNWYEEGNYCPDRWGCPVEEVCYFKISCLDPDFRGRGLGQILLKNAIDASMAQGAKAGIADIWLNSPNNSAYKYFSRAGGEVVNIYHSRWSGKPCIRCGKSCECLGAEMILRFKERICQEK